MDLPVGKRLSEPNLIIDYIYFPNTGLISTDAITLSGEQVEIGVIGCEGFSGSVALFDQPQLSHSVVMQGAGEGHRIRAALLRAEFQSCERTLRDEEVTVWAAQIVKALETLGGTQRA